MTTRAGISPLERRILLAMVSHIRDREHGEADWDDVSLGVPTKALYERLYVPGDRSYQVERRNQRQAQRRALKRLFDDDLVNAVAGAWVDIRSEYINAWQGGGRRRRDAYGTVDTPRWVEVSLTDAGLKVALLLEREDQETA